MKKILIIVGSIIILTLLGVWVFLLLQEDGEGGGVFANLGFGDTTDETVPVEQSFIVGENEFVAPVVEENPLRQLTSEPVVGYAQVLRSASSTPEIYYVEAGTSHVYKIDELGGEAIRLSNTTVTGTKEAAITADGQYVVLRGPEITILTLPSVIGGEVRSFKIYDTAVSMTIIDNELLYTTQTPSGAVVKQFDLSNRLAAETLFTIPFREVTMAWGSSVKGTHYYYPKPAAELLSQLYSWESGTITREPIQGYELNVANVSGYFLYQSSDTSLRSRRDESEIIYTVGTTVEKCSSDIMEGPFVCATPQVWGKGSYIDWLQGELLTIDQLVLIDIASGNSVLLDNLAATNFDITGLTTISQGLLFTDRRSGQLWQYRVDW